jgi:hypothetical protein
VLACWSPSAAECAVSAPGWPEWPCCAGHDRVGERGGALDRCVAKMKSREGLVAKREYVETVIH